MAYDEQSICAAIVAGAKHFQIETDSARDIAFHMTDWIDDLTALEAFYRNPGEFSAEDISELLLNFLLHAPDHLAAAKKLFSDLPVTDVFDVGAVSDD